MWARGQGTGSSGSMADVNFDTMTWATMAAAASAARKPRNAFGEEIPLRSTEPMYGTVIECHGRNSRSITSSTPARTMMRSPRLSLPRSIRPPNLPALPDCCVLEIMAGLGSARQRRRPSPWASQSSAVDDQTIVTASSWCVGHLRPDFAQPAAQEAALDGIGGEAEGPLVGCGRLVEAAEASQEVGPGGVEVLVPFEAGLQWGDELQPRGRPVCHRDRHRPVQLDNQGRDAQRKLAVEGGDAAPVGVLRPPGPAVLGGNGRLEVVDAPVARPGGLPDERHALLDFGLVPALPVLVLEQHELPRLGDAGGTACVVQEHEGEQAGDLRL